MAPGGLWFLCVLVWFAIGSGVSFCETLEAESHDEPTELPTLDTASAASSASVTSESPEFPEMWVVDNGTTVDGLMDVDVTLEHGTFES